MPGRSSPAPCFSEHVWDYHFDPQTNVIDVHVSRLRAKIDKGFERPLIHTVRGAGYVIRDGAGRGRSEFLPGDGLPMTALGKLFRTTAFKLSLVYLVDLHRLRLRHSRLCGLERASHPGRSDHLDGRGGDQRPVGAIPSRRHPPAGDRRRAARQPARRLAVPGDDPQRRARRRQCRRASARHADRPGQREIDLRDAGRGRRRR